MKQLAMLGIFLLIPIYGICDTIDFWHVYINDSLIAIFNKNSKDLTIEIKGNNIKAHDMITVRYGKDTRCFDCHYGLIVLMELKRKMPEAETKEYFGKLSISLKELLDLGKEYKIDNFSFIYYERTNKGLIKNERLVFVLNIT